MPREIVAMQGKAEVLQNYSIDDGLRSVTLSQMMTRKLQSNFEKLCTEFAHGKTIARLTVMGQPQHRRVGAKNTHHWFVTVRCQCGHQFDSTVGHLRSGHTVSCGCLRIERYAALNRTHGCYSHPFLRRLRAVHAGMLRRCKGDPNYVSKGIQVCPEWRDCAVFILWALKHGYEPGLTLDRTDNKKGYGPDNCCFVTDTENACNKDSTVFVDYEGLDVSLSEQCRANGRNSRIVHQRIARYGWTPQEALNTETSAIQPPGVYLVACEGSLAVGRTSSYEHRIRKLHKVGYKMAGYYATPLPGFLEVLLHNWLDGQGVTRRGAPKRPGRKSSFEAFARADAIRVGFRFRKLCTELESTIPRIRAELQGYANTLEERLTARQAFASASPLGKLSIWLKEHHVACTEQPAWLEIQGSGLALALTSKVPIADRLTERCYAAQRMQRACAQQGHKLLFLDDVPTANPGLEHWLLHKIDGSKPLCGARQCVPGAVDRKVAAAFYAKYHLQGSAVGQHFGLFHGTRLVACATFAKQAPERKKVLAEGSFALTRMAFAGSVPGAASRLFKYAVRELRATAVVTYSDNRYSSGEIYPRLGFSLEAEIEPDYRVWHPKLGLRHKSYWQRRAIPSRLVDLCLPESYDPETDPRTEFDMEELAGCQHVWDCGKKRWRWHAPVPDHL